MKRRLRFLSALLLAALFLVPGAPAYAETPVLPPPVGASGAVLLDGRTGRVLFERDAHARLPMASTTKVMTALVAIEHAELDLLVRTPDAAAGVEGSSIYLARGEQLTLRDLLYGLMLTSGNDAAVAIAHAVGGSIEGFAAMMNARAESLGCTDTRFVNPNGLPAEGHYTSAYDLAVITSAAMQNAQFREIVSTTYYQTSSGDRVRTFKNKNRTLWSYEGGCGVKTGFTKAAGRCLTFAAERDGMLLIGTVLNCPNLWDDAFALLDYGFSAYETKTLVRAETCVGAISVENGVKKTLEVYPKHDILYAVPKVTEEAYTFRVELPASISAPAEAGQAVGRLILYADGVQAAETPLIVRTGTARADFGFRLGQVLTEFFG